MGVNVRLCGARASFWRYDTVKYGLAPAYVLQETSTRTFLPFLDNSLQMIPLLILLVHYIPSMPFLLIARLLTR